MNRKTFIIGAESLPPIDEYQTAFERFGGSGSWLTTGETYHGGVFLEASRVVHKAIGKYLNDTDFRDKTRQLRRTYMLECVLAKNVLTLDGLDKLNISSIAVI